jgi:ABC-type transport system involved in cytochrome c biogenesis permease subunit
MSDLKDSYREMKKAERDLEMAGKQSELAEAFDRLPPVAKSIAAGAAVGSMVPIIGTGIGAVVGGIAGLAWKFRNK